MKPIKNKKRIDPRYFLHEAEEDEMKLEPDTSPGWRGPEGKGWPGGMDPSSEPDATSEADPKDIQILQAIKELLESSGRRVGTDGLAKELNRLAEIVAKNPEFDVEEPEMSDDPGFELPTAPSTRSPEHQRLRTFRNS